MRVEGLRASEYEVHGVKGLGVKGLKGLQGVKLMGLTAQGSVSSHSGFRARRSP